MQEYIRYIKDENSITKCQFFKDLLENNISLKSFKNVQYNFYPAITYFTKPLFIICSKMNNYNLRWKILENIIDEHGGGVDKKNHGNTYKTFLINLGLNCNNIDSEKINKHTLQFNEILLQECMENHWVKGVAMISIMEDIYIDISKIIYEFLVKNKYLDEKKIVHYKLHEEIDVKHSVDMYKILSSYWNKSEFNQCIKEGLYKGNNILLNLFSSLYFDTLNKK